ncbi:hypothetical protein Nepgr_025405 [Nepenthes gracilis]|uniref:Uncharacterized protein n=1 Tax=Nepenthes gracilis TaxID=150966 RepID=A0AAD3XZH0_NEPGR|nr:hypothetical protein Nepgr_025405 [Nepenthes gracilis]
MVLELLVVHHIPNQLLLLMPGSRKMLPNRVVVNKLGRKTSRREYYCREAMKDGLGSMPRNNHILFI